MILHDNREPENFVGRRAILWVGFKHNIIGRIIKYRVVEGDTYQGDQITMERNRGYESAHRKYFWVEGIDKEFEENHLTAL